jgi:serine/threonine-protein kinase
MGEVYLARHPVIGKLVAIKILRDELSHDQALVARFSQEAQALNAVRHPNIVEIIDYGRVVGRFYFTMELLEGESLAARLPSGLAPAKALHIVRQCARALAACHDRGIVHRDLKPENIFLQRRGDDDCFVKVLDFGIARVSLPSAASVRTQAGHIFGTPMYMSPEQAAGEAEIDGRADIYSLGVVLYELLTGTVPFRRESFAELIAAQLTEEVVPPSRYNPRLSRSLEQICLQALARRREDRFASMHELERALAAEPPGVTARLLPARKRSLRAAALVAAGAALTAALLASGGRARPKPAAPAPVRPEPRAAAQLHVVSEPPGAAVSRDGTAVGTTPLVLRLLRSATPVTITVRQAGFVPFERQVTVTADLELAVQLQPIAPAPATARRVRKTERRPMRRSDEEFHMIAPSWDAR